jgi:tRNA (guanine26-N2/guanine27-N2)-dimethyltransferase
MASDTKLTLVTEGKARFRAFLLPAKEEGENADEGDLDKWEQRGVPTRSMPVFYNPAMVVNRNISVLAVNAWKGKPKGNMDICDAMCGAGVRGIRYLLESGVEGAHVDFVDLNPAAIRSCIENIEINQVPTTSYATHVKEANAFLFGRAVYEEDRFAVIDVDPFGNPMPYISGALKALRRVHGLLHVNATDLAVMTGVHYNATLRKYQVIPMRDVPHHAEISSRVLIGAIFRKAMEQDITIKPLFTIARRHFVKVIMERVSSIDRANADRQHNIGYLMQCRACKDHFTITLDELQATRECHACKSQRIDHAGPLWIGELEDGEFCKTLELNFKEFKYMQGKQETAKLIGLTANASGYPPGSHDLHEIAGSLGMSPPSMDVAIESLKSRGVVSARDAINPTAIKTRATRAEVAAMIKDHQPTS